MKRYFKKLPSSINKLLEKKQYIELITATLTVPVLATAIILNFNNLKSKPTQVTPTQVQEKVIYVSPVNAAQVSQSPSAECKEGIAPLDISSPEEGEVLTDNPVNIDITYTQGSYCSSVWSYRINNGRWSEYDDRSIALYNLAKGKITFELRVKSLVSSDEKIYKRTFEYEGTSEVITPVLTPSDVSSSAAN